MPKTAPMLLTQAQYARSRKARGLSGGTRESVRKAVDAGRISAFGPDKMIDAELADRQWANNTQSRAVTRAAAPGGAASGEPPPPRDLVEAAVASEGAAAAADAAAGKSERLQDDAGYQQSRARQAAADARKAELELAELEGLLVRVDQVRAELATRLAPVREALLQIPARLAPLLAPQSDPGRIQTMLEAEIHKVLAPLSVTRDVRETEGQGAAA